MSKEEARKIAEEGLRDLLRLDPNVPVWLPDSDEFKGANRTCIRKSDVEDVCCGVSTQHSRHLILCHCLLICYVFGPKQDKDAKSSIDSFGAVMVLAEAYAKGENQEAGKAEIRRAFPGLRWWEIDLVLSGALRYGRFLRRYFELLDHDSEQEMEPLAAREIVHLLHGDVDPGTAIKSAMVPGWLRMAATDLDRAATLHPCYLAHRLSSIRNELEQWTRTIPADLKSETGLILRNAPGQYSKRDHDSASAFVQMNTVDASKGKVGAFLIDDPEEDYRVRESIGNRAVLHFNAIRSKWVRTEKANFFVPGEPSCLNELLRETVAYGLERDDLS